jgi:hypothetical protein
MSSQAASPNLSSEVIIIHEDNPQQDNDSPEIPRVCRQGLLGALRENLRSCHATVINGRAGTGKTVLAVDFVRSQEWRAAWYKVDAPDLSLPVFMEYLVASVARVRPGFGCQTLDCCARAFRGGETVAGGEFDVAALAEAYVYDLERQAEPLVLVIDDLHLIYDADWIVPFSIVCFCRSRPRHTCSFWSEVCRPRRYGDSAPSDAFS